MPSTSKKQANFMKAVANNPKFAKKAGVPSKVGKDFSAADSATKKFKDGGSVEPTPPLNPKKIRGFNDPDGSRIPSKKDADAMMKPKAKPRPDPDTLGVKKFAKGGKIDGVAKRGRTSTKMVKMACGGKAKKG